MYSAKNKNKKDNSDDFFGIREPASSSRNYFFGEKKKCYLAGQRQVLPSIIIIIFAITDNVAWVSKTRNMMKEHSIQMKAWNDVSKNKNYEY